MSFRLCAKTLFLTYPQCNVAPDRALEVLNGLFRHPIDEYIIAQEKHADGNLHLHCYLKLTKKCDVRNANGLDIDGFHGNYMSCKSPAAVKKYCRKENNYITNIPDKAYTPYDKAIEAENRITAEKILMKECADVYIKNFNNVQNFLENLEERTKSTLPEFKVYPPDSFVTNIDDVICQWILQIGADLDRCKLLIVGSPPSFGKTSFFRNLDPEKHSYMRSMFSLQSIKPESRYTIIDDWCWDKVEIMYYRSMFLGDGSCTMTDKYKKKINVVWRGIPCVILTNDLQRLLMMFSGPEWDHQIIYCNLEKKLIQ